ncbi:YggT family protein [Iocasia frigidifontis]|uniref:YggT family protein n=1 Tax=Iocasia fonsfrigidae TaxID=2682810 RepID=A0A8A7K8I2_9FIRM|nr:MULTISPECIES: YggT family protein [Halanaerobiaceae]AZO95108.1 YggT family protein [Halocella sp. SP3-1]QTL98056.1 YggT family protein [Iocasia fonsfrigidae]
MYLLVFLVNTTYKVIFWLILIRAILSWVRPGVHDPNWRKILSFIYSVTEPILGPIRRLIPTGNIGIDFSPLIAMFLLSILRGFIINLLYSIGSNFMF